MRVVIDTNVLVAGLRSRLGASFRVLTLLGRENFEFALTVPLLLEYQDVLGRAVGTTFEDKAELDALPRLLVWPRRSAVGFLPVAPGAAGPW